MRHITRVALISMSLTLPFQASATGLHECAPTQRSDWLSEADLTTQLESQGWSVRRMKPDGGCWEVYGTTPEGKRVEGYFHPITGAPELIAQRGRVLFRAPSD
jgi:hypothetical protein